MADDAFALSPISARASLPTEADYDAICGAFMETARGRWFLGEYAKRNRNADTRMVLDAVERIEATLATQKAAPDHSLAELLPAITELIASASQRILESLPKTDIRPATEPIQRAGSVLRDVAWTLRESGADTRVCDLLDVQAKAIVDGCARLHGDQAIAPDVPATVAAALESLTRQINALVKTDAAQPSARAETPARTEASAEAARPDDVAAAPARREEAALAPIEPVAAPVGIQATLDVVAPDEAPAPQHEAEATAIVAQVEETAAQPDEIEALLPQEAMPPQDTTPLTPLEADVQANLWEDLEITDVDADERLAEPIAYAPLEEPAPEPNEAPLAAPEAPLAAIEAEMAEPVSVIQHLPAPEPMAIVDDAPSAVVDLPEAEVAAAEPGPAPKPAPTTLGQAAIESGVIAASSGRHADALAPIRRMSQAEKIAFFS
jgi:hypothetical protein